jgi:hypothetical protein
LLSVAEAHNADLNRWMQPDPAHQFASPYVFNGNRTVLSYDKDGRFAFLIPFIVAALEGALIGAAVSTAVYNVATLASGGKWTWGGYLGALKSGAISGAIGSVFAPIGVSGGWYGAKSVLSGALSGGLSGGFNNLVNGENFWDGFGDGAKWGAAGGLLASQEFSNLTKGQGFNSNTDVLNKFAKNGKYQEALDYFGFEGKYDPNVLDKDGNKYFDSNPDTYAITDPKTGNISYHDRAFNDGFDHLFATYDHERVHVKQFMEGRLKNVSLDDSQTLEFEGYYHNFKNEGLYLNNKYNFKNQVSGFVGFRFPGSFQDSAWYDFLFKIPRRSDLPFVKNVNEMRY